MTKVLEIAKLGDLILRQSAQTVEDITDPSLQKLIDNLILTAKVSHGVGIAAPQVYSSYRCFIVASHPNPRYPKAPKMEPTAMINPKIINHSKTKVKDWEGCLSVPGLRGLVPRYSAIEVEYCDRKGTVKTIELTDFVARIFQHELDHLEGILFIDRVENAQDFCLVEEGVNKPSVKKG